MPLSDHAPRLEYLKRSASFLEAASPSTAAHLMSIHNTIIRNEFKPLNQRQQDFACGACGCIRNPTSTRTVQVSRRKKKLAGSTGEGATVLICLRCRRRTVKPSKKESVRSTTPSTPATTVLNPSPTQSSISTMSFSGQSAPAPADQNKGAKSAENASSKKRAKARKQGGLQALMASKQQSRPASSSLDLFDFLQQ
ncbi:ribonuclease P Rpr2/Rpp21/SNM1 subunit [Aspergillus saccharolyticus JOP 1030-1]|uniref:Cullin binding protein CanA n=1 Tax=Aspergillus saccharolyticus JOP 1030-1 TaxID=1450539 RepID=A0A319AU75_9EURO|nr:hypothetical protein BP01DRAFT_3670 [Aspergillus saccharolyticus JOP 1030-1]PYH49702.1 hypothetical protein BP01DRAFT_3670 [Aspergillus saccharolyticus JOP 1030-1]